MESVQDITKAGGAASIANHSPGPERAEIRTLHEHRKHVARLEACKVEDVQQLHVMNADLSKQVRDVEKATAEVNFVAHTHGSKAELQLAIARLTTMSRAFGAFMGTMLNGMVRVNGLNLAMKRNALPPDLDGDCDDPRFERAASELREDLGDGKFMFEWTESSVHGGLNLMDTAMHSVEDTFAAAGEQPHPEQPDDVDSVSLTPGGGEAIALEEMQQQRQSLQASLTLACAAEAFAG